MSIPAKSRAGLYSFLKSKAYLRSLALAIARFFQVARRPLKRLSTPGYRPPALGRSETISDWISVWNSGHSEDLVKVKRVHEEEDVENKPPGSLDGRWDNQYIPQRAVAPPAFVFEIPDGRIVGDGVVLGPDDRLIVQVSKAIGSLRSHANGVDQDTNGHFNLEGALTAPARHLPGTTLVMSTFAGRGYFHWLFDVLPRLGLAADGGIDLTSIDWFVVNNHSAGYQIATLASLGIDRRRIVTSFRNPHLVADRLIVPSLSRENGITPSWVCEFLRRTFPPKAFTASVPHAKRIYISRAGTDHGRLPDERRLTTSLRALGFTTMLLERLTMEEKATVFDRAEVVLGPSGAGLSSIVFGRPGTVVVDICTRGYPTLDSWDIANRLDERYFYVPTAEGSDAGTFGGAVDTEQVLATLRLAGVS